MKKDKLEVQPYSREKAREADKKMGEIAKLAKAAGMSYGMYVALRGTSSCHM